jgi:diguanylate cyclase (GGDEF)-like protein
MSLIPMFVFGFYLYYYIMPTVSTFGQIFSVFVITIFLMVLGFYLAKEIIYPIMQIATHARGIAEGEVSGELDIKREDELGQLSHSLNRLSARLKENMSELHSYGEKIKQINMEINRKVFALSSLLQIGNLITTASSLDEVLKLIVEKLSQLEKGGATFLALQDKRHGPLSIPAYINMEGEQVSQIKIKAGQGPLGKIFASVQPLIIDTQKRPALLDDNLKKITQVASNIVAVPVTSSGKTIGILATGNSNKNYIFLDDEVELIGVFAKQVAVAVENDMLLRKTEELSVLDELTGLYNENYMRSRLDEEIKRAVAYQRPCSYVILELNNFKKYRQAYGEEDYREDLKRIALTLKGSTTEIDKVGRLTDHSFALILPEKTKTKSKELVDSIRKKIEDSVFSRRPVKPDLALTLGMGITSTPIDGSTAVELINQATNSIGKE